MNLIEKLSSNKIKVAVIDSGVGGLSVFAEVDKIIKQNNPFDSIELFYINVVPDIEIGYNKLENVERKIEVFNDALYGIKKHINPDMILIACNTLSVICHRTDFSKNGETNLIGIVETGVEMFFDEMKWNENQLIIIGTETTINSNSHKELLLKKGIKEERIITQSCPGLESSISLGPESSETKNLIKKYLIESVGKISGLEKIYLGLCCTHYGYAINSFEEVIKELKLKSIEILNPNKRMAEIFSSEKSNNGQSLIKRKVISKVVIEENVIKNLYPLLAKVSVDAAESLKKYEVMENLFYFMK